MDETSVRAIEQLAIAANDNRQARMPEGTIALPDNFKIHDLEKYLPLRRRFRGAFATASLADFVTYVKAHAGGEGFIDGDQLAAKVFFNLGTVEKAEHADWTATLQLKATAAYRALLAVNGQRKTQRDMIEWLEDWNRYLGALTGEANNAITIGAAIEAIRKINITSKKDTTHVQDERRASLSSMEEVEASAGPSLVKHITFVCEPYLGLPGRTFDLRMQVLTSHDDPLLILRVASLEEQQEEIAKDFKEALLSEVGDSATLTIGSFTP